MCLDNFLSIIIDRHSHKRILLANSLVEWTSAFETLVYLFILCGQIFSFYTVQILTFADDSSLTLKATKLANSLVEWTSVFETSVYLLANSLVEWTSVFETSVLTSLSANFLFFIQYSTEKYSTVQVFIWCLDTIA